MAWLNEQQSSVTIWVRAHLTPIQELALSLFVFTMSTADEARAEMDLTVEKGDRAYITVAVDGVFQILAVHLSDQHRT